MSKYIEDELGTIALGDERLNSRCRKILAQFWSSPTSSINGSFSSWQEVKAAYRFFDNSIVNAKKILLPHQRKTEERIAGTDGVVLCVQDSTIIDYSHREQRVEGLGKLRKPSDQGLLLHPTIAFNTAGTCLGMLNYKTWTRQEILGKKARQIVKPIEEKESMRWVESYRITNEIAGKYPDKLFINIADREGDFYELLQEYESNKSKAQLIVRAKSNRSLEEEKDGSVRKLWDKLQAGSVLGQIKFKMSGINKQRTSREVIQTIRACEVRLSPPRKVRKLNSLRSITINAVAATEENPPVGEKAVEWLLLTSLDIKSEQSKALDVVKYYQLRWQIELYFKTLKSGCGIEKLQLENINRIENCLAIYMIVAWRILFLTYMGRACPTLSCEFFYEKVEWKAIYIIAHKTKPPAEPPSMDSMNKMVACFGGFLNRKSDGLPGIKSMWIGLQRLKDFTLAFELFGALNTCG